MDDIAEKLTELLNDPAGMEQLRSMAEGLIGGANTNAAPVPSLPVGDLAGMADGISPEQLGSVMKVVRALGQNKDDDRTRLLMALRPHLSEKRRARVDQAVKLLKLSSVIPLIGESGLFSL